METNLQSKQQQANGVAMHTNNVTVVKNVQKYCLKPIFFLTDKSRHVIFGY